MLHSIISFNDAQGRTIDFHRLKQKRPATVLKKIFEGFNAWERIYLDNPMNIRGDTVRTHCKTVTIHYTEYESTPENLTFECSFDDFMTLYNEFKAQQY